MYYMINFMWISLKQKFDVFSFKSATQCLQFQDAFVDLMIPFPQYL